jgi:hypothetical protein
MQVTSCTGDTHELAENPLHLRQGMKDVAAHPQVELSSGNVQIELASMFEWKPWTQMRKARTGQIQMRINYIDAEHIGFRKHFGKSRSNLAGAATGIEDAGFRR